MFGSPLNILIDRTFSRHLPIYDSCHHHTHRGLRSAHFCYLLNGIDAPFHLYHHLCVLCNYKYCTLAASSAFVKFFPSVRIVIETDYTTSLSQT